MKNSLLKKLGVGLMVAAFCGSGVLMAMAGGSVITTAGTVTTKNLTADGAVVLRTEKGAKSSSGNQNLYTITYDYSDPNYDLALGGKVYGSSTVTNMAKALNAVDGYTAIGGVNGDHFSFQYGIPMGFSMDDGRIVESPASDKNAGGYMFHAIGITRDGKAVAGYNPTLISSVKLSGDSDENRIFINRINRTRESYAPLTLFTEDYGTSTKSEAGGLEFRIKVTSGAVSPQANPLVGTVEASSEDGDMAIEPGTVVLSASGASIADLQQLKLKAGDKVEMNFGFLQEEWNNVDFAIGGHYAIVQGGKAMELDYSKLGSDAASVFESAASRTGFGITKDGKVVIIATDGRNAGGGKGLTANEMARYMAEDLNCEYAILLDGGGSTEMVTMNGETPEILNTPSDKDDNGNPVERRVGNGLFVVKLDTPRETTATTQGTKPIYDEPVIMLPESLDGAVLNGLTAVYEGETLKLVATEPSASITYTLNTRYNIKKLPNLFFDIDAGVNFDATFSYTGLKDGTVGLLGDFALGGGTPGSPDLAPAGHYTTDDLGMVGFIGGPNWNKNVPDDGEITINTVTIQMKGPGTVLVNTMYMSKFEALEVPSHTTAAPTTSTEPSTNPSTGPDDFEPRPIISKDADAWTYPAEIEVKAVDGGLEFSNTNGQWPAASYILPDGGFTFDPTDKVLKYDFTAAGSTNIILFFKDSLPDDFEGKEGQYTSISSGVEGASLNGDDILANGASFKGEMVLGGARSLGLTLPAAAYNDDGTVTLRAVKIFVVGGAGADSAVTLRDLSLAQLSTDPSADPSTDPSSDPSTDPSADPSADPSTDPSSEPSGSEGSDPTATSQATVTTGKNNSPNTGEGTAAIAGAFALAALAVSGICLCRKMKKA